MNKGEWTRGMALALASAVEVLLCKEDSTSLSVIERLRGFKPLTIGLIGGRQRNGWELAFESLLPVPNTQVKVYLTCDGPRIEGQKWERREVTVIETLAKGQGEFQSVYRSRVGNDLDLDPTANQMTKTGSSLGEYLRAWTERYHCKTLLPTSVRVGGVYADNRLDLPEERRIVVESIQLRSTADSDVEVFIRPEQDEHGGVWQTIGLFCSNHHIIPKWSSQG